MKPITQAHSRRRWLPLVLFAPLLLAFQAPALADARAPATARTDHVAVQWRQTVERISLAPDTAGRAAAVGTALDALGLAWRSEAFEMQGRKGVNLFADLGGAADAPLLLIGAHYDRVDHGHGATDNASGVAAVLELARGLKARPLPGHRVRIAFWDLEEHGLLGSRAWVAAPGQEQPALYVNFDVFGWGDTLWMMAPDPGHALLPPLRRAASGAGVGLQAGPEYPPTDHRAFLQAGWPAVSFSLVGGQEIEGILDVFAGRSPARPPKVMQVIHSERDVAAELDSGFVPAAVGAIEEGLRAWDSGAR